MKKERKIIWTTGIFDEDGIDDVVCEIMMNDGPDGHVDGHEIITDFICAILEGDPHKWVNSYRNDMSVK